MGTGYSAPVQPFARSMGPRYVYKDFITGVDCFATPLGGGDPRVIFALGEGVGNFPIYVLDSDPSYGFFVNNGAHDPEYGAGYFNLFQEYPTNRAVFESDTAVVLKVGTQELVLNSSGLVSPSLPVFNVQSYGAVGNGVHDDTTAVQNAINAAHAVSGIVWISVPCRTTSPLTLPGNNITFMGPGMCDTIITGGWIINSVSDLFSLSGTISNIAFYGVNLISQNGGGHIFVAPSGAFSNWQWCYCNLVQQNGAKSIFSGVCDLLTSSVSKSVLSIAASASVSAWIVQSANNACNHNTFEKLLCNMGATTSAHFFHLENTGATGRSTGNKFNQIDFEIPVGGVYPSRFCRRL